MQNLRKINKVGGAPASFARRGGSARLGASLTKVKICGITRTQDALAAAELGADALGFNFWPRSKRRVEVEKAAEIASELPPFVLRVGVFVNQPRAEVVRIASRTGMQAVQLHGDESPQFCSGFPLPVIKAVRVEGPRTLAGLDAYTVAAFLLDSPSPGYGGSGVPFDWDLVGEIGEDRPIILAGGLTPTNVAAAVRKVKPYAVDVAGGVESRPGIKDHRKLARFIRAAKQAHRSQRSGRGGR
jgi:phosphoribosylanthranilate isomerase